MKALLVVSACLACSSKGSAPGAPPSRDGLVDPAATAAEIEAAEAASPGWDDASKLHLDVPSGWKAERLGPAWRVTSEHSELVVGVAVPSQPRTAQAIADAWVRDHPGAASGATVARSEPMDEGALAVLDVVPPPGGAVSAQTVVVAVWRAGDRILECQTMAVHDAADRDAAVGICRSARW